MLQASSQAFRLGSRMLHQEVAVIVHKHSSYPVGMKLEFLENSIPALRALLFQEGTGARE